jgi:peptide/nickel transport system substrate-binding protein
MYLAPVAIPGLPLVGFLNTDASPTDDPSVRQALILATDRAQLVQTVFGPYSPVAMGPLSRSHPDYDPAVESLYSTAADREAASALLEEAGWVMGEDGLRRRDGQTLQLQAYLMTWGLVPEVAELLQAQWRAVGVDLVLNEVTFTAALAAVAENRHHVIFWSEPGTDADLLRSFFHSESIGVRNWSNVRSPQLDSLLDEARVEGDPERRSELYSQVQTLVMEDALILPIRDYVNLNGVRRCVSDLRFDTRGWFPILHDVQLVGSCR